MGDGRFCASGLASAPADTVSLTTWGLGGADLQAGSERQPAINRTIGRACQFCALDCIYLRSARFAALSRASCSSYAFAKSSPNKWRKLESASLTISWNLVR